MSTTVFVSLFIQHKHTSSPFVCALPPARPPPRQWSVPVCSWSAQRIPRCFCPSLPPTAPVSRCRFRLLPFRGARCRSCRRHVPRLAKVWRTTRPGFQLRTSPSQRGNLHANTRPSLHPRIHLLRGEASHGGDGHGGHGERGQQAAE